MGELFVSLDVETDGPCPGVNSMLSIGAALIDPSIDSNDEGMVLATFEINLETLPNAAPNADTMKWWKTQPREAWEAHRRDVQDPHRAMHRFDRWIAQLQHKYNARQFVPLAWPAAFDWSFLNYYFWRFYGENRLGYQCADVRSYISGAYGVPWLADMNPQFVGFKPDMQYLRPHVAVDDAIMQGVWFGRLYRYLLRRRAMNPNME